MERKQFLQLSDACLQRIAVWLERFDPDEADFATTDGVVTIEFADRTRYVLNRQTAADQMWFAAGARAWHYDWNPARERWLCDKDGHDLYERISEVVSEKLGRSVEVR